MKILITGANGFVGYWLTKTLLEKEYEVIACSRGESRLPFTSYSNFVYEALDLADPFAVHDIFEKYQPAVVIHTAAMSKPDDCERDQWNAYVNNVEATITLLTNVEVYRSHFIFLSTDFVFDGIHGMYSETDSPSPVNYYGKTKLQAEQAVQEFDCDWAIARTVLVYGKPPEGKSNLLTVVEDKLRKGEIYNVFTDQIRTPTYVEDLVDGIIRIMERKAKGIFHLSGKDVLSPYEMAVQAAKYLGLDSSLINPVTVENFEQFARRPAITGFNITKARTMLGYEPISFQEGLRKTFPG